MNYLLLFISAFGAATILPLSSELVLVALLMEEKNILLLWSIATFGNTLGSVVNWCLGRYFRRFENHRCFPFKPKSLQRAQRWFARYGVWSLLLAWVPMAGDGLTFMAGVLRVDIWRFLALVAIGKGARYGLVIAVFFGL